MEDNKTKAENLERAKTVLQELNPNLLRDDIIRENNIEFELKETNYRVRMPSNKERREADRLRSRIYLELVKDKNYRLRDELAKDLKQHQNIDIDQIDENVKVINEQIGRLYEKLATLTSENKDDIKNLEKKILDRFNEIQKLSIRKAEYLAFCIEEEVYARYLEYMVIKCTEVQNKETKNWEAVWLNQEAFDIDTNMKLAEMSTLYLSRLITTMRGF